MRIPSSLLPPWLCLLATIAPATADEKPAEFPAAAVGAFLDNCAAFGFSGSVVIVRGGKTVFAKGYGFADRAVRIANTPDTLFEIASATKPFTACAVLKLVEQGGVALDDPIGKHLPGVPEDKAGITVRHLLAHTSGMPRSAARGGGHDLETAVRGYLGGPASRMPGKAWEYWNGGYALLAGIVERVSGKKYTDFVKEHLFKPAGLRAAGFTGDADLPRQAVGYHGETSVRAAAGHPYRDYGYQYRGMGGMVLSANELQKLLGALHAGKLLKPESVRLMQTAATRHYGLGWGMAPTPRGTRRVGHGGNVRGFHTQMQHFPDEDTTIVVLCNVDGIPLYTIAWNLEAVVFGDKPQYPMPPAVRATDGDTLAACAGRYVLDEHNRIVVERSGNGLRVAADGPKACAALGATPVTEATIKTALQVTEAARDGDAAVIEGVLMKGIPTGWPRVLVDIIWPRHVERWGECRALRVVGGRRIAPGRESVLIELQHAKGAPRLNVVLQNGKLNIFDLQKAPRYAVTRIVQPVAEGEGRYAGFAWRGPQPRPVRFEDGAIVLATAKGQARFRREVAAEKRR